MILHQPGDIVRSRLDARKLGTGVVLTTIDDTIHIVRSTRGFEWHRMYWVLFAGRLPMIVHGFWLEKTGALTSWCR